MLSYHAYSNLYLIFKLEHCHKSNKTALYASMHGSYRNKQWYRDFLQMLDMGQEL